ncbi:DUF3440 domain-containing protein [Arthrobacter sp. STN4]|uniref:DUF3440 domain-containing protein n=1 Tax=Arthrobacter sp. STN4 TaxID=2923276 RepID=UPI00211A9F14|nr:DUF3440 domain-containing protein [Arthrobacter sp. STN4]MCQ9162985.1 DUF3440 domain-containing protein [Arthrobacter sp. STN4]
METALVQNVWEATQERLKRTFEEFDNVIVAFSGGKDSGVVLNATIDYMRDHGITKKISVYHLDYEGQYTATTDYVTEMMTSNLDLIEPYWICLPVAAQCGVSMYQDHWRPWDPEQQEIWARPMPEHPGVINTGNVPADFPAYEGVWDYKFNVQFARWHHRMKGAEETAVLVGIREQESLHRYAAINRQDKQSTYQGLKWTTEVATGIYNAYPVHDWVTEDVWVAHAKFDWTYNGLYDLFHLAGIGIHQMRVASPFNDAATDSLKLYRVLEPAMWAKLVGRVNGANFAAIYGGTAAMGAKGVKLPPGHSWKTYAEFLLTTLPVAAREGYLKKMATSIKYWTETGGALRLETVQQLQAGETAGVEFLGAPTSKRTYSTPYEVVRFAEYPDDLLEISNFAEVPTWKRLCITILRNDYSCKYMGFGQNKLELEKRKTALAKYKEIL